MSEPVAFCIGLNRTGTTTFGDACEALGFTRLGWTRLPDSLSSHDLMKAWSRGDIAQLVKVASGYEVLEDLPWPLVYRQMAETFPSAKFVLTRRSSVDQWLESQAKHTSESTYGMHAKIYGSESATRDPDLYRERYQSHLAEVRRVLCRHGPIRRAVLGGRRRLGRAVWVLGRTRTRRAVPARERGRIQPTATPSTVGQAQDSQAASPGAGSTGPGRLRAQKDTETARLTASAETSYEASPRTMATIFSPHSVGFRATCTPAAESASILAWAVPWEPEMMAPAWPILRPGGAVTPAM